MLEFQGFDWYHVMLEFQRFDDGMGQGRGLAGLCYNAVFIVCQETEKQPKSNRKENRKTIKTYSLNVFLCFLFFVFRFFR